MCHYFSTSKETLSLNKNTEPSSVPRSGRGQECTKKSKLISQSCCPSGAPSLMRQGGPSMVLTHCNVVSAARPCPVVEAQRRGS